MRKGRGKKDAWVSEKSDYAIKNSMNTINMDDPAVMKQQVLLIDSIMVGPPSRLFFPKKDGERAC